jgi:hypothetical protein
MMNKIAVQFRKNRKVNHAFQRLKYCISCGNYSVMFDNQCPTCKAQSSFISVEEYSSALNQRLTQAEIFSLVSIYCVCLVLASNLTQLSVAFFAGIALMAVYFFLLKRYKPYIEAYRLQKLLVKQTPLIAKGLEQGTQEAVDDIQNHKYKDAYEKLREVGAFLTNDRIKVRKIMCLNNLIIRKDMELELESIIPSEYDKDFIAYLYEVSKVNKQLIRQSVLDYVVIHRERIELLENGKDILTNVVGAALRMKHYVETYQSIIIDYVELLPRERFLRLCKMLAASPQSDWNELANKCKETTRIWYGFDPDFQGIW